MYTVHNAIAIQQQMMNGNRAGRAYNVFKPEEYHYIPVKSYIPHSAYFEGEVIDVQFEELA